MLNKRYKNQRTNQQLNFTAENTLKQPGSYAK